ncbi:MAG: hypothetical protein KA354_03285 [Phycisphaerae bacterium]|nr:hypothetical protein [Phycisphaerae bacterium]
MDGEAVASRSSERRGLWIWSAGAGILSGGLMAACDEPVHFHQAGRVALVPWFAAMSRVTAGAAWLYGALLGVIFYRISLGWQVDLAGRRVWQPWSCSPFGWAGRSESLGCWRIGSIQRRCGELSSCHLSVKRFYAARG